METLFYLLVQKKMSEFLAATTTVGRGGVHPILADRQR